MPYVILYTGSVQHPYHKHYILTRVRLLTYTGGLNNFRVIKP